MTSPLAQLLNQETMAQPAQISPAESPTPVRGTGGGLADLVPADVAGQPAALSEGEFVWPADVVSMLGDGSSEAGARILNGLMEEIRKVKQQGSKKQSKGIVESLMGE